jgi:hypothetical protein
MSQELIRTIILAAIITTIFLVYAGYVITSFFFMNRFGKKIKVSSESISVIMFQKYENLDTIATILIKSGQDNPKLILFEQNDLYKKYTNVQIKDLETVFNKSEEIYSFIKSICANLKEADKISGLATYLIAIDSLNSKYYETIQLYNTYVVGYNYWRNLFFTKWIKVLFRKDTIDTIK